MKVALLLAAKLSTPKKVGTYLHKGRWELLGGRSVNEKGILFRRNEAHSHFSPPLGSIVESNGEFIEVEVSPDERDSEIFLFYERIEQ